MKGAGPSDRDMSRGFRLSQNMRDAPFHLFGRAA
jgi:hypothetical protein